MTRKGSVLRALSADAQLLRTFEAVGLRGRVHTVFRRVVNIDAGGALCTIAGRDVDNAPATLVVDAAGFDAAGLHPGDAPAPRRPPRPAPAARPTTDMAGPSR